jgi:hypothetical protein
MTPKHPRDYLWYLASPYSIYKEKSSGLTLAFEEACIAAGLLMTHGYNVYSPIAMTHSICKYTETLDPLDHELWTRFDKPFVDICDGLIVLKLFAWSDSRGVAHEIQRFTEAHKPILYMEPSEVPWTLQNLVKD